MDFDALFETYKKWLACFPNLKWFKNFKKQAEVDFLEIISHECTVNPYFPLLKKRRLMTKKELLNVLIKLTKETTKYVESNPIFKEGEQNENYGRNLIEERKNLKLMKLHTEFGKSEKKYLKHLDRWLQIQKEYFFEMREELEKMKKERPKVKRHERKEKKTPTLLEFFKGDKEKVDIFFNALSDSKSAGGLSAIDKNRNWLWKTPMSSIRYCFEAIILISKSNNLKLINHRFDNSPSLLYDMIEREINFDCKKANFVRCDFGNIDLMKTFKNKFRVAFRAFL